MEKLQNFVTPLHLATERKYLARMVDKKVECMSVAKLYGPDYWDGPRSFGYGGYKYIPGRWKPVAEQLILEYGLKSGSKVLDVGCGKGFLLYEMKLLEPGLQIQGFDISDYALEYAIQPIKPYLFKHNLQDPLPFCNGEFDLVISLGVLHNLKIFDLKNALFEIERVGSSSYVMLESYRNDRELFNLQCWALTCESFFNDKEWLWLYKEFGFTGDYEFIFFE
jgi:SAM-dependent methyltransferase